MTLWTQISVQEFETYEDQTFPGPIFPTSLIKTILKGTNYTALLH